MSRGIVLGASSGIGAELARRLLERGDEITLVSRRAVTSPPGSAAVSAPADIRDFARLEQIFVDACGRGPLDYVVNCVGVGFYAPLGVDNSAVWNDILTVNVTGLLNLLSVVDRTCPELPRLVHVSSMAAHRVSRTPGNLAYSVAKAGAKTIVEEYRRGLRAAGRRTRVSMVSPGFVEATDFGRNYFSRTADAAPQPDIYGSHRNLSPADVADVVAYVLGSPPHLEFLDLVFCSPDQPG
ncbi:SDR family oxidoreductase [Micromonospora sp. NPDC048170]|uniref:SDR family oxidoreductase n=1 Tax=Micromonospora sp. NPDC048170 TaxID=3154819 RepID=UPI0033DEDEDD